MNETNYLVKWSLCWPLSPATLFLPKLVDLKKPFDRFPERSERWLHVSLWKKLISALAECSSSFLQFLLIVPVFWVWARAFSTCGALCAVDNAHAGMSLGYFQRIVSAEEVLVRGLGVLPELHSLGVCLVKHYKSRTSFGCVQWDKVSSRIVFFWDRHLSWHFLSQVPGPVCGASLSPGPWRLSLM